MKTRCFHKLEAASTLVEVVVAVAVVGIAAGGVLGSVGYAIATAEIVRENQRATQILLEKFETIRLYNWTQVNSNGFVPTTFTDVYSPQALGSNPGVTYYGTLVIGDFPFATSYSTNLRQLTATLCWTNGIRRVPHFRTLSTYIARDGEQNYIY
jgi:type II secretory pathway pseudopilin PulG